MVGGNHCLGNINIDEWIILKSSLKDVRWIHLSQNRVQWQNVMNAVVDPRLS
jgi:hypothetical protein